jgi:essential nuclear protein 1
MSNETNKRRTIADIIMEKLTEKKTELQSKLNDDEDDNMTSSIKNTPLELDQRVIDMYKQIKDVLSKYRSGKLPKAFKIIPSLNQWEYVINILLEKIKNSLY